MLTNRQCEVLKAIDDLTAEVGYPPSVLEIAKRVNLHSKSSVFKHIESLCAKGMLTKVSMASRSLLVTEKGKELLKREN